MPDAERDVPGPPYLTTEELRRDVSALREILQARLDGMDRATVVLSETVNRTPTAIQIAITNLRELMDEKLLNLDATTAEKIDSVVQQIAAQKDIRLEKFASVEQQFIERDVRTEQAATASASALAAALQAAKEAVFEQAQAAAKAAEKTELSFTKQIDQIQLQIKTIGDGFSDRIAELKERIDRGEGQARGGEVAAVDTRANDVFAQTASLARQNAVRASASMLVAGFGVLVSLILAIFLIVHGG